MDYKSRKTPKTIPSISFWIRIWHGILHCILRIITLQNKSFYLGVDEITKMIIDDLAEFYINELDSSSKVDDILDNFSYSSSVNSENNCSGTDDE